MYEARFSGTDIMLSAGDRVVAQGGGIYTFLAVKDAQRVKVKGDASGCTVLFSASELDLDITPRGRSL